jgi:hypothetical protein
MSKGDTTQQEAGRAFQHVGKRRAATEYEEAHSKPSGKITND